MRKFGGWEVLEELGRGGQGIVYKACTAKRAQEKAMARLELQREIGNLSAQVAVSNPDDIVKNFISTIGELSRPDDPATELGAVKKFDLDETPAAEAAVGRFEKEVKALTQIQSPGILKLIEANVNERWFAAEYHPRGSLASAGPLYMGDAVSALTAFRTIVDAVEELHKSGYVHRDIKSNNVFLATDDRLVLGDFGIVFFEDSAHTRLTDEFERVGSRDWMAPWAHTGLRVDDVNPTFDIFPLGKLLWVMISGQRILPPYRTHRSAGFNLEALFPDQPGMELVNSILDDCIVMEERDCHPTAEPLLAHVDLVLNSVRKVVRQLRPAQLKPSLGIKCRFCGLGSYELIGRKSTDSTSALIQPAGSLGGQLMDGNVVVQVNVMSCNNCGHVELFDFRRTPSWWEK